jgi:5'-nucleotidase
MTIDLSTARILVTNDDGVEAEGIAILEKIARRLSPDIWTVGPDVERSGAGHSLTITSPVRCRELSPRR